MICPLRNLYDCDIIIWHVATPSPSGQSQPSRARRLDRNTVDTHHGRCLLDGCSAQTPFSSGYQDKTITKENIHSNLAKPLLLETLHRGAAMCCKGMWDYME